LSAYDIGRAVNPMMIHGQIAGGYAQGLGGRAVRGVSLQRRRPALVGDLRRIICCRPACEVSHVDVLVTEDAPSPLNPLGLKGAGEAGVTAVGAAIASAIDDAIGIPGAVTELPVTPQRLLALLAKAR
jgi:carbon-monoxide dehydrogenase large subunit/6-hydroxypseudooxynicotine dehydrogenase subunit gamma